MLLILHKSFFHQLNEHVHQAMEVYELFPDKCKYPKIRLYFHYQNQQKIQVLVHVEYQLILSKHDNIFDRQHIEQQQD
jgi:hypothetical protein